MSDPYAVYVDEHPELSEAQFAELIRSMPDLPSGPEVWVCSTPNAMSRWWEPKESDRLGGRRSAMTQAIADLQLAVDARRLPVPSPYSGLVALSCFG